MVVAPDCSATGGNRLGATKKQNVRNEAVPLFTAPSEIGNWPCYAQGLRPGEKLAIYQTNRSAFDFRLSTFDFLGEHLAGVNSGG